MGKHTGLLPVALQCIASRIKTLLPSNPPLMVAGAMLLVWWGLGNKTADTCPRKFNLVKLLMVAALACTMHPHAEHILRIL